VKHSGAIAKKNIDKGCMDPTTILQDNCYVRADRPTTMTLGPWTKTRSLKIES